MTVAFRCRQADTFLRFFNFVQTAESAVPTDGCLLLSAQRFAPPQPPAQQQ
jgi:hypothetical protein